jgi:DNA-binding MarR family transcriptional regulator
MSTGLAMREKHDGALAEASSIKLWLRLLSCTMVIEKRIKRRLADRFDATLPRFDVLAALTRHPEGMTMGALSRSLLVSNGNVTALVQTLLRAGLILIAPAPADRRASVVRLTPAGDAYFAELADAHHGWIEAMLAGLGRADRDALYDLLGALKRSIADDQPPDVQTKVPA